MPLAGMNQLRQAASDGRALLQTVAGKAIGKVQVVAARVQADDGIVVKHIHLVITGPGALQAQRLEGRDALG